MLGYVGQSTQEAADTFFPGYARAMTDVGKERGWPPMTRASFDAQRGPDGALLIGSPDEVVDEILRHSEALGGVSRISFQMNVASLPQMKMMRAIDAMGPRSARPTCSGRRLERCENSSRAILARNGAAGDPSAARWAGGPRTLRTAYGRGLPLRPREELIERRAQRLPPAGQVVSTFGGTCA